MNTLVLRHISAHPLEAILDVNSKVLAAESLLEWPLWEEARGCPASDAAISSCLCKGPLQLSPSVKFVAPLEKHI